MIRQETITEKGIQYDHTYSDAGFMIERDGVQYTDAIDPLDSGRVSTETDIPIEPVDEQNEVAKLAENI